MPDITDALLASMNSMTATVQKLDASLGTLTSSIADLVTKSSAAGRETASLSSARTDEALGEIMLQKKSNILTEDDILLSEKLAQAKELERQATNKLAAIQKKIASTSVTNQDALNQLNKDSYVQQLKIDSAGRGRLAASKGVKSSLLGMLGRLNYVHIALKLIGFAIGVVIGQYNRQKKLLEQTSGALESSLGPSIFKAREKLERMAWSAGLMYEEMMKSVIANRQTVNALGGTAQALEKYETVGNSFLAITGHVDTAFQLMLESSTALRQRGFVPSTNALKSYALDLQTLSYHTGIQSAEAAALYNEVASDTDSMVLLRAAREGERESILASQRALINMNVALGMSADQAKEAAKMLNKMIAAKPLERIKQAARIRALGGAFGIGGSAEAARAIIAGPRASAEQKEQLMRFSKSATRMADQMRGQGLGQEIFATMMLDKLDLEQYYGSGSSFSDTLISAMKDQTAGFRNALDDNKNLQSMRNLQETSNKALQALQGKGLDFLGIIAEGVHKLAHPLDVIGDNPVARGVSEWFESDVEKRANAMIRGTEKQSEYMKTYLAKGGGEVERYLAEQRAADAAALAETKKISGLLEKGNNVREKQTDVITKQGAERKADAGRLIDVTGDGNKGKPKAPPRQTMMTNYGYDEYGTMP